MKIPVITDLLDLFLPVTCAWCREIIASDQVLCTECLAEMDQHRLLPEVELLRGLPVIAPFEYAFPLNSLIVTAKNRDLPHLLDPLVREMKSALIEAGLGDYPQVIVPVPLHHARKRERGFDQARYMAEQVAGLLDRPYLPDALRRIRATPPQKRADRKQRLEALHGAFGPGRQADSMAGQRVLLVDDVVTTGATVRSACEAMQSIMHSGVLAAVAARTPLSSS